MTSSSLSLDLSLDDVPMRWRLAGVLGEDSEAAVEAVAERIPRDVVRDLVKRFAALL